MSNQTATVENTVSEKQAVIYRMVMAKHFCPHGLKTKDLLERNGFTVEDNWLESRDQTDSFKQQHTVASTPQVFIDGERVGGYEDVRRHFGLPVANPDATSYRPVIAIFVVAALIALAISWLSTQSLFTVRTFELFIAVSMCILGVQKLQDIERFSTMFLNYDLLARRFVRYGYIYPFAETLVGLLMIAGTLIWLAAPIALVIGTIGAISVIKAVYIDKRELKCACVGGNTRVPLGFVSLTENVMMVAMALWMFWRYL